MSVSGLGPRDALPHSTKGGSPRRRSPAASLRQRAHHVFVGSRVKVKGWVMRDASSPSIPRGEREILNRRGAQSPARHQEWSSCAQWQSGLHSDETKHKPMTPKGSYVDGFGVVIFEGHEGTQESYPCLFPDMGPNDSPAAFHKKVLLAGACRRGGPHEV